MQTVRLALEAMATRFELVMYGDSAASLRAAGEEALAEIRLLESMLSFYRPSSEVSRINKTAHQGPVCASARVFQLLKQAASISTRTFGAFDVTVAPLMNCWGFVRGKGLWPDGAALDRARAVIGMQHVVLNEKDQSVAFTRDGVSIDLGGIGKGYAIDEAALVLKECGVDCAFLHGGTSTMIALGTPPNSDAWRVAIPVPGANPGQTDAPLAVVALKEEALSVSAEWGKAFEQNGRTYGHVIDPRTGFPVQGAELSAVVHASATTTDALSTALLVLGSDERAHACKNFDKLRYLVACRPRHVVAGGIEANVPAQAVHYYV